MVSDRFVGYFAETFMKLRHSTETVQGKSKFEALVILISVLLGFLTGTGLFRRTRRFKRPLSMLMLGAYVALPNLISNALGRLNSLGEKAGDQVTYLTIWATVLLIGHACADSMNAVELNNNEEYKKYILQFLIFASLLGWLIITNYNDFNFCFIFIVSVLWGNIFLKVEERARAFWYASKPGMAYITRVLSDFMMYEHKLSKEIEANPKTLKGYKYLLDVKNVKYKIEPPYYLMNVDTTNVVTIDKIWEYQDQGELLSSTADSDGRVKDLCLSMSLFWLLLRRFGGYRCYESVLAPEKTWRLVVQGLLTGKDVRSRRVFRVIEVELKFLHDFLFTKYFASYYGAWQVGKRFCEMAVMITFSTFYIWITSFLYEPSKNNIITWVVLTIFSMIEFAQVAVLFLSEWSKVWLILQYVQNDQSKSRMGKLFGKFIRLICKINIWRNWSKELGQYSLVDSHDYDPWILCLTRKLIGSNLVNIARAGQTESKSVKLSPEIQEALVISLQQYDPDLQTSNERSSWRRIARGFSGKYCKLETKAHVIMVWHIATSYCEMSSFGGGRQLAPTHLTDFKVAMQLSNYCAYLVAMAPKLVPEECEQITKTVFDELITEAKKVLSVDSCRWCLLSRLICRQCSCKDEKKVEALDKLVPDPRDDDDDHDHDHDDGTNIKRAVRLGKKLKFKFTGDDTGLWKLLAEFWSDMLLFLADPSADPIPHGEYLAKGGELITHMWALLNHAGIDGRQRKYVSDPPIAPSLSLYKIDIESN